MDSDSLLTAGVTIERPRRHVPHPRPGRRIAAASPKHAPDTAPSNPDTAPTKTPGGGWLFSPAVDLFFIANLFWPLLLLVDALGGVDTHESLLFWQIYFVTAPHRWITLVLVVADGDRIAQHRFKFGAVALGVLAVCLCLRFGTGSLLCLGAIDYIWNAWHFSSQHHGISRIYQRKESTSDGSAQRRVDKVLFRGFLLYVIARVAGVGWREGPFAGTEFVVSLDWVFLLIPVFLVARQCARAWRAPAESLAGAIYLTSVMTLFTLMLAASHWERGQLVLNLALASAVFHSLEYIALVTWSVQNSRQRSRRASPSQLFAFLSKMWLAFLMIFVVVIGAGNYLLSRGYFETWVLVNLVVAFWHYGFDGMIWKGSARATVPQGAS